MRRDHTGYHLRCLRERALEFRNLAVTARDPDVSREFHHLATLCEEKAATLERAAEDTQPVPEGTLSG